MGTRGREKRVEPAWGREKPCGTCVGEGKNVWNPRGFIAPNPRKVRGVHELRGNPAILTGYYYLQTWKTVAVPDGKERRT